MQAAGKKSFRERQMRSRSIIMLYSRWDNGKNDLKRSAGTPSLLLAKRIVALPYLVEVDLISPRIRAAHVDIQPMPDVEEKSA